MTRTKLMLAVVAFAGAAAFAWWRLGPTPAVGWQGYVDADYVKVAPTQQGLLTTLSVSRGQTVHAGASLFAQDDAYDRAARDEAAAKLAQAEAQLRNLQSPARDTEIAQAAADLADLRAVSERTRLDLQRAQALAKTAAGTRQRLDQAQADADSAAAKVVAAEARLAQLRDPTGRASEISAQQATVKQMRAQLAAAQWRLDQRHVTAPVTALVADIYAWPGETVNAGAPVVSLLPADHILVRFFVGEPELPHIHPGQRVAIGCDTCPTGLTAAVSFISPQPEYTPPVIFSEQTRDKLVYLIEARPVGNNAGMLKPGQPVSVRAMPGGEAPPPPAPSHKGRGV